ncbi:uncharacterized protein DDB_G0292642 [Sitodiplosis mosellana]|uniref:uncharacterized protein DDB_G0292642 n=1 Tax=Sitodiplosis mosellana TaxID=263140 RepID=UPI0024442169|nr:uncharacterized protein DDB_G0292642 [Sitodiplosis mosellana]XP_055311503.1 uncharacterized protein DDB_G0292642 [Sitodiplosis mosellana]XP_055311504.1 uncharacterized protein DDB_G0292642 [Sitodiplosis mosellana]XP_055311505.1 uncharacterized protein DDB_G0292642 [Sitodiplosis mosellana]XP_055311506.1 uncharacterized protein DDB_G0292642 [Sitodiplosis mosellana]XP_055311507.1 uncharacterized protein DDB_G0292642 [Sitodiplosis mosellana]XP_055311508.1 uncharacterized protein DDB_G0292642 [
MRPTRNWTTYVPESESTLRKKCIELSPTLPLSSSTSTSKSVNVVPASRCNQNNNNQIKDCEQRNGMKTQFLRQGSDCVNKTASQFGDDNNDAISALSSSATKQQQNDTTTSTTTATLKSPDFKNSTTANINDIDAECDKSSTNLECAPLIQLSPNKSITLVKQNSTSLIFTKKDVNPVVHRKRITLVCNSGTHSNGGITTTTTTTAAETATATPTEGIPIISHTDESISSPKKRHSFNWHSDRNNGFSPSDKSKRKQIKSWYAVIGSPSVRESTFDSDTEDSFEPPHVDDSTDQKSTESKNAPISYRPNQFNAPEMGHHATTYGVASGSKYNRFEQLLKNLVGRKVSRESPTIASSLSTSAIIGNSVVNTVAQSHTSNGTKTSYSSNDTVTSRKYSGDDISCTSRSDDFAIENQQLNQPLLVASPEIKISRTPSAHNLFRNDKCLTSTSSASTTSLNATMHQRLWSVVPLLRREGSCASLNQNSAKPLIHQRSDVGLKKCETVSALSHSQTTSNFEPIKARNRLRQSQSVATCSRCSSILSLAANGSRYSLNIANGGFVAIKTNLEKSTSIRDDVNKNEQASLIRASLTSLSTSPSTTLACKLCLNDVKADKMMKIQQCGCQFCIDCMKAYVEFEILEGAYEISCPDALCSHQGIMNIEHDIAALASSDLVEKHKRFRLNREIELDKNRTWCPRAGCETVCLVEPKTKDKGIAGQSGSLMSLAPVAVKCPTCVEEFCSSCKKAWHPMMTCEENSRRLVANGADDSIGIPFDTDLIKCCPMCGVPIEKDEGCAQMMCKRCKHVFCWYCLASLDDDFLLRHYDKGPCKNKLGHSRASVVWHRAQVIGIFASFGILLLVASPLLLLAAPCIVCCKCRACSTKLDDVDNDFDDPNNGAQNR